LAVKLLKKRKENTADNL